MEGLLIVDKPPGPTSHDVVAVVRRATGQRRAGHSGTLDPFASGLLAVALGPGTRLIRFLDDEPKVYTGRLRLGATSDTDDGTGHLTPTDAPLPSPGDACAAASRLEGESLQRPPRVSARKVGGKRLYALARRGVEVEAPPRSVRVETFRLEPTPDPAEYAFRTVVSGGTYVRALARDMGAELGCGGYVSELRREACGRLDLSSAVSWSGDGPLDLPAGALVPIDAIPLRPPAVRVDPDRARAFRHGRPIEAPGVPDGEVRVLDDRGDLVGVAAADGGRLRPEVVLPRPG